VATAVSTTSVNVVRNGNSYGFTQVYAGRAGVDLNRTNALSASNQRKSRSWSPKCSATRLCLRFCCRGLSWRWF